MGSIREMINIGIANTIDTTIKTSTFKANIRLEDSSGSKWAVCLKGNTLPVDFSTEEIDIWITSELVQYEV